jgi:HPt (histidine-containing phosphotransfer) domain-containing protein
MTDIERKMAELAARFADRADEERAAFTASLAAGDHAAIAARAHRLAGIAGMYGHPLITEAALALEAAAEEGHAMDAEAQRLLELLAALKSS